MKGMNSESTRSPVEIKLRSVTEPVTQDPLGAIRATAQKIIEVFARAFNFTCLPGLLTATHAMQCPSEIRLMLLRATDTNLILGHGRFKTDK